MYIKCIAKLTAQQTSSTSLIAHELKNKKENVTDIHSDIIDMGPIYR